MPRFYFGCEADDRMYAVAFNRAMNPFDAQINAVLSSDLSHWDVPDMRGVVRDAFKLVERGLLFRDQFRDFAADNCIRLHGQMNRQFFDGTTVEAYALRVLSTAA